MKRKILLLFTLLLVASAPLHAQLAVASFSENVTGQDAKTHYPKIDQDGRLCALLKISTTQKGFTFNCGSLPVVDVVYKSGEVWVYLPEGTLRIKITHDELGSLEGDNIHNGFYEFDESLKSGHEYYMRLESGSVRTTVEARVVKSGWLILKSDPSEADVYLVSNGVESLEGHTPFQKKLEYGNYSFRVKKSLYHDYSVDVSIDQPQHSQNVSLLPAHGRMYITSTPSGASVAIDGVKETYTTPCTTDVLPSGSYTVRFSKEKYSVMQKTVVVEDGKTAALDVNMSANFSGITINTLPHADIYLNGSKVGTTTYTAELTPGVYDVEARLASHRDARRQIQVELNKPQTIQLDPTPVYGELDVISTPMEATITIDGKNYGSTPLTISSLLVGNHEVTVAKEGFYPESRQVTVEERRTAVINVTLGNVPPCPSSDPSFSSYWGKAHNGDPEAMVSIGLCYQEGTCGVEQSYSMAIKWYRKAADNGNPTAMANLGNIYYRGDGASQNFSLAVEWYRKAADKGNADGMYGLGRCYYNGEGVKQSYFSAVEWYRKAADKGNTDGMCGLGRCYYYGEGTAVDYDKAVEWYRKAAEMGSPAGMSNLGNCYYDGKGVVQNYSMAVEWFSKAADMGDPAGMNGMGFCYDNGRGVAQNFTVAVEWFRKAAEKGNASAMRNMGFCYEKGRGVAQNYSMAVEWYRKAADKGNATAMNSLGVCYDDGRGVAQNSNTAFEWYRKAADKGHAIGMRNLGTFYEQGKVVERNFTTALEWYNRAKEAGCPGIDGDISRCQNKAQERSLINQMNLW